MLGREFARDLLAVDGGSELYHVTGLVTPPRACRASRGAQHFFVNGRYVKNRTMMAALENAYKGTMMQGKFPGAVLMLELPPDMVDVNVHPAKTEIRFAKESDVFDAVYRAVRAALATPGSGECRFEMGHTAPEEKPGQTVMQPAAPAPARGPLQPSRKGRLHDAVRGRIPRFERSDRARPCALAADGAGRSECTGHTACPGRAGGTVPEARLHGGPAPRPLTPVTPVTAVETPASEPVTIPAPQPMPHAVSDDTVLDILPELPDDAPTTDPETDYVRNDPHALSALPDMVSTVPSRRR